MPQAIAAFLITAVGATGLSAALITAAVTIGFTVGANALLNAIFGPSRPKPSDGQQNVSTPLGSRCRDYGVVHSGGQWTFRESRNGTLGQVLTLSTGEQSEILEHRINDKVVTVVGNTITEASYRGAIHIYTRPGTDDQTAIGELTAKFGEWTSDHRQLGCPHVAVICDPVKPEHFSEVFNGQVPQYSQVRKGVKLYDPRQDDTAVIGFDELGDPVYGSGPQRLDDPSTWAWSDNGALVTADYFAHPDGYGGGYDNVNWTNIAQEADHCDAAEITVTGDTIPRWRIWARYALASEERRQILTDMLKAIDGFCWQDADAKFCLMTGRFEEPDIALTDDHLLSMVATLGAKAQQQVDAIKVLYTEAAIGYREQESATIANPDFEGDPQKDAQALQAYYAPHHNQATRIGKLAFAALGDDRWRITAQVNLFGLILIGRRFVRLSSARLGVTAYFKVDRLRLNLKVQPDKLGPTIETSLTEVRPEDWNFDAATEEGAPPAAPGAPTPTPALPAPTGLELTDVQIALGAAYGVAISASWDDPGRPDLTYAGRYRPSAGGAWVALAIDDESRTAQSGLVDSGTAYDIELWAQTLTGRRSAAATATITPAATVPVPAPGALSAEGGIGAATLRVTMPLGAVDHVRLYGADSDDFGSAAAIGADIVAGVGVVIERTETGLAAGSRFYWAAAFDGSGGMSPIVGPALANIS